MKQIKKAIKDMVDLEAITKNIEENYKPANIELTSYEQEQEDNAIISYDELLNNKATVSYDNKYSHDDGVSVRKVKFNEDEDFNITQTKIDIPLMSYDKEEAFLEALKQLQSDLAR